jgi:hypothetical protein
MLTQEEIQLKAETLTEQRRVKVYPIIVDAKGEQIVGYIEEPKRQAKYAAMNELAKKDVATAGELILDACLIKEESDKRLYSQNAEHDSIVIGAAMACLKLVEVYEADLKKN